MYASREELTNRAWWYRTILHAVLLEAAQEHHIPLKTVHITDKETVQNKTLGEIARLCTEGSALVFDCPDEGFFSSPEKRVQFRILTAGGFALYLYIDKSTHLR